MRSRFPCPARWVVAAGALLVARPLGAQGLHLVPGVAEIASDSLADVALASVDSAEPTIYYNPLRLARYGPLLSTFFIAHEYGHIARHHSRTALADLPDGAREAIMRDQELDADCYAAVQLGGRNRAAVEAAIRFFTRLGPFRFDAVHPTGSQRATRLLLCMPPRGNDLPLAVVSGETGVEIGPVSGDPEPIRFRISATDLSVGETGNDIELWIDGQSVGRISNLRAPTSLDVTRFAAGLHSYRLSLAVYAIEGEWQSSRIGMVSGTGHIAVRDGDDFRVAWFPGGYPSLIRSAVPESP